MNKYLLGLVCVTVGLITSGVANAQDVNCDNVKINLSSGMEDHFKVNAIWKTNDVFPNPSKTIEVGDNYEYNNDPSFEINCPSLKARYDGEVLEMKSDSYAEVIKAFSSDPRFNNEVNLYRHSWYRYPNIHEGFMSQRYRFNLATLRLKTGYEESKEDIEVSSYDFPHNPVIGYKVDGGALKPLLFDNKVNKYIDDFDNANTIDVYHKNSKAGVEGEDIQRIFVDKPSGLLRIYRNYEFPSN